MSEPEPSIQNILRGLKLLGQTLVSLKPRCDESAKSARQDDPAVSCLELEPVIQRWRTLEIGLREALKSLLTSVGESVEEEAGLLHKAESIMAIQLRDPHRYKDVLTGMDDCLTKMTLSSENMASLMEQSPNVTIRTLAQSSQEIQDLSVRNARYMDHHLETLWALKFKNGVARQDKTPRQDGQVLNKLFARAKKLQYYIIRSIISIRAENFDRTVAQFQSSLEEELISCNLDPTEPFDFDTEFCPAQALFDLIQREGMIIQDMYKQSTKVQASPDMSLSELPVKDFAKLHKVSKEFWRGLATTKVLMQIFATLMLMKSDPVSRVWFAAWQELVNACRDDKHRMRSWTFPLDDEGLKVYFGQLRRAEALSFRSMQYCFCALAIEKGKQSKGLQVANNPRFRLPLKSKKLIAVGDRGTVFRVRVAANYLFESDKELAMKDTLIADARQDEWRKTMWMLDQVRQHDCIMRAHASLKIEKRVLIFYDLAKFDLLYYMRHANEPGPSLPRERKELFQLIAEIADALQHLHCDLKRWPYRAVCFHNDVKAENILVCERNRNNGGPGLIFKLTDFGISSLETEDWVPKDDTRVEHDRPVGACLSLRDHTVRSLLGDNLPHSAPEARNGGLVSAGADVWAYGTVLSEYLAWLYGGASSLDDFVEARTGTHNNSMSYQMQSVSVTDSPRDKSAQMLTGLPVLREGVNDWFNCKIGTLSMNSDRGLMESCWELVKNHILVPKHTQRSRIEVIVGKLDEIARDLDNDMTYM